MASERRCNSRVRGFTLVELLVTLMILAVLMALTIPLLRGVADSGRRVACLRNLSQFGVAFGLYANDHDDLLPWATYNVDVAKGVTEPFTALGDYLDSPTIKDVHARQAWKGSLFHCPSDSTFALVKGVSYVYFPAEDMLLWPEASPQRSVSRMYLADPMSVILKDRDLFHAKPRGTRSASGASAVNVLTSGGAALRGNERVHWSPQT
ncbi:MAG TPA: type II secretion system protein [Phycisphaerales bacterium]|nr:type II secretion system protein [Phycisphaerales bacterium]